MFSAACFKDEANLSVDAAVRSMAFDCSPTSFILSLKIFNSEVDLFNDFCTLSNAAANSFIFFVSLLKVSPNNSTFVVKTSTAVLAI